MDIEKWRGAIKWIDLGWKKFGTNFFQRRNYYYKLGFRICKIRLQKYLK